MSIKRPQLIDCFIVLGGISVGQKIFGYSGIFIGCVFAIFLILS